MCVETVEPRRAKQPPMQRDWILRIVLGNVLGLSLALLTSAIFSQLAEQIPFATRGQLMMWMVPPIWLGVLGSAFFFASGLRAGSWLGAVNMIAGGLLWLLHTSV